MTWPNRNNVNSSVVCFYGINVGRAWNSWTPATSNNSSLVCSVQLHQLRGPYLGFFLILLHICLHAHFPFSPTFLYWGLTSSSDHSTRGNIVLEADVESFSGFILRWEQQTLPAWGRQWLNAAQWAWTWLSWSTPWWEIRFSFLRVPASNWSDVLTTVPSSRFELTSGSVFVSAKKTVQLWIGWG